jgi:hypothetical protein
MHIKSVFWVLIFLTARLFCQNNQTDFFIAQNPAEFEIYNRYQIKISSSEKEKFAAYTPWRVLNRNTLLGDQITHAMQAENKGILYYFILNADGSFKGDPDAFYELFENCSIIDDQIIVKQHKGVLYRQVPFSNKTNIPRNYLEIGTHLSRLFKKGPSYFIKNLQTGEYGWIRFNKISAIDIVKEEQLPDKTEFNIASVRQLQKKVSEINSKYLQLFNYLNSEYSENKIEPHWNIVQNQDGIILKLENIRTSKLKRSTSYFLNDIENIFAGEKVFISSTDNTITISLNDEK